jgi:hypothetical protein
MKRPGWKSSTSFCSLLAFLLVGCAAGKIPPVKTYAQAKKEVEARGALVSPPVEEQKG